MKDTLDVVLDIDGVLADFEGKFCTKFGFDKRNLVNLEKRYPREADAIREFVTDPKTYKHLSPLKIGQDINKWLSLPDTRATIHIVSSRPVGSYEITKAWLRLWNIKYTSLTIRSNKIDHILSLSPDIIVDDIISVAEEVYKQKSIPAILVAHPWNETYFFPRISTLESFKKVFHRETDANLLEDYGRVGMA